MRAPILFSSDSPPLVFLTASTICTFCLFHRLTISGIKAGGCCKSESMTIQARPRACASPAQIAASFPKFLLSRRALSSGISLRKSFQLCPSFIRRTVIHHDEFRWQGCLSSVRPNRAEVCGDLIGFIKNGNHYGNGNVLSFVFFPPASVEIAPPNSQRCCFASGECINHGYNKEFLDYCS